jgi:MFS family permease
VEDFILEQSSSCYSCGHVTTEVVTGCPKCGRRLRTAAQVRRLGWLQLAIGVFLVGLMGTITYNLAPSLLPLAGFTREGGARFTGTPEQAQLILGLFGLVIAFGLGSILSGLWQIKTGRRNKWLFIIMVVLFIVLIFFSWYLRSALRGA